MYIIKCIQPIYSKECTITPSKSSFLGLGTRWCMAYRGRLSVLHLQLGEKLPKNGAPRHRFRWFGTRRHDRFFVGNELTLMQKGCIFRLIVWFVKSYALLISDLLIIDIWSCWISATWTWHRCDLKRLGLPSMWFTSSESYADLSLWWDT